MRSLDELAVGEAARVRAMGGAGGMRRRLMDLGFTPGAEVECLLAAPGRGMRAYRVRRTVIALRRRDAAFIQTEEKGHG